MPALVEAREIIAEFHLMFRRRAAAGLASWLKRARASLVASFANGVTKDEAAVHCLGRMDRQKAKSRVKLVRRQMYGRGNIDLLQTRLIGAE
jgi:transposase